jgi:gliding motility-associated-like protein
LPSTVCNIDEASIINTPNGDTIFDVLANIDFCIPIEVFDPNTGDTLFVQGEGELLNGEVLPTGTFPDAEGFSNITQDFCWSPVCENVQEEPYVITITAFSRGCANEILITEQDLYFNVFLEPDESTLLEEPMGGQVTIDLYDPSTHCFDFVFVDPNEADTLIIEPTSDIFALPNVTQLGLEVDQGTATLPFCWNVVCDDVRDEPYLIDFEVIATNCESQDTTNFTVEIFVVVPEDEDGVFAAPLQEITWEFYAEDTFCMPVNFVDPNFFDTLTVTASSEIFELSENPARIDTLEGLINLNGNLCWVPRCEDVREEPYIITFTGNSFSCKTDENVIYTVELSLVLPPETPPQFDFPADGTTITHFIGDDPISFNVVGSDPDPYDTLYLSASSLAFESPGNPAVFNPFVNTELVASEFAWTPDCPDVNEEPYLVTFILTSRSCQKNVVRELTVPMLITTPTLGRIEPIQNIFTPNGDGRNDAWTIENKDDPCLLNFNTQVFDRWGKEVFQSSDPGFEWNGENTNGNAVEEGVYYRIIEYFYKDSGRSFNGELTITR